MKRLSLVLILALSGCAYQPMRFGLQVSDLEAGSVVSDRSEHRALVYAYDATTSLRPEAVEWTFGGVFEAGSAPGTFRVKGPGQGTIQAVFRAGDRQMLAATLTARSSAPVAVAPPVPTPQPTVAPTPVPTAPPAAAPDAETLVLDSYRLQGQGDYFGAVLNLVAISDPAWLPKARALLAEWGERGADQGLARARALLEAGNRSQARENLEAVTKLPLRPTQRQTERALRLKLGDRP
ncbi:MAG TPA: hypothetical protein V6D05_14860 [Stenomitos sp.]